MPRVLSERLPLSRAGFDAARTELRCLRGSEDRFARQVEGLNEIQKDIDESERVETQVVFSTCHVHSIRRRVAESLTTFSRLPA